MRRRFDENGQVGDSFAKRNFMSNGVMDCLGTESFDGPLLIMLGVKEAVVDAGGAALPEFDGLGDYAEAAPEGG